MPGRRRGGPRPAVSRKRRCSAIGRRNALGDHCRNPHVVAVTDGATGRWVSVQRNGFDRVPWTTIWQASTADLPTTVQELLAPKATGVLR